jgi:hypothetical protein
MRLWRLLHTRTDAILGQDATPGQSPDAGQANRLSVEHRDHHAPPRRHRVNDRAHPEPTCTKMQKPTQEHGLKTQLLCKAGPGGGHQQSSWALSASSSIRVSSFLLFPFGLC